MKILLIVPDGVAVRNYLYSSFVSELEKRNVEVMLYHQISDSAILEIQKVQKNISKIKRIPFFVESFKARILRESLAYARLLRNKKVLKNETIMTFWNSNPKGLKQKILYRFSELLGSIFSKSDSLMLKLDSIYEREIQKSNCIGKITNDLNIFKPDLVLNLHQRAPVSAPIINVSKQKNIKTATVIYSWDNVPKGRLISRYDIYLVWSDIMCDQLALLYPEIKRNQIKVVGTPQFEFYQNKEFLETKEVFFQKYGLDINKKTICFSANDTNSPYEVNYVEDICDELGKIKEEIRPQILFRRCPVDKSNRFDEILKKYYPFIISIDPDWRVEKSSDNSFTSVYPAYDDISILINTVKHSDIVINFGSTMAHDFAVYNKPCLYLNYDPVPNSSFKVDLIYKFQHFKSMEGLNAVSWINSKSEIAVKSLEALNNPDSIATDRKAWMERIVKYPLEKCSINLTEEIIF